MSLPFKPLGILTEVIESMGLNVTYAYEDLVFIEHNAFLLRMGEKGEDVYLYFNEESEADKRPLIVEQLTELASPRGFKVMQSGTYLIKPREDKQLDIHFNEHSV